MSRALVLRSTLVLLLAGGFLAMVLRLNPPSLPWAGLATFAPAFAQEPAAPTADDLAVVMRRLNLAPQHLAAAGLTPQQTADFIKDIAEALIAAAPALNEADQDVATARAQADSLKRLVRSGQAGSEDKAALDVALEQLAEVEADRDSILDNLHALTHEYLSAEQAQNLGVIRGNARWTVPTQYIVVDRSQAEWVALREALANLRIADKIGEDPDDDAQALIAQTDANQNVSLAKASLDTNLPHITAEWNDTLDAEANKE